MYEHGKLSVYEVSARTQCPYYRDIYEVCFIWPGSGEWSIYNI